MSPEFLVLFFAVATGFVAAGLVSSFHTLVTNRPASFRLDDQSLPARLAHLPLIVFGGPSILMRNAVRGRLIERRPMGWLWMSLVVVASWSFVSGLFVLHVALSL